MARIKFDVELIRFISIIQKITKSAVKDCIESEDKFLIIIGENEISKAIGKGGANVKKLERALKRKVKLVEYNSKVVQFIKNLVFPLKIVNAEEKDGIIIITPPDTKTRGYLIGRNAQNLRYTESIAKRYFPIKEIKVEM